METSLRSYRGDVALGPLADPGSFRERIHVLGADLDFSITPAFGLRLFGRHDARTASSTAPEYQAGIAGLELHASF